MNREFEQLALSIQITQDAKIDIGKRSPAVPVIPPGVRVRTRRFGGLR